MFNDFDRDLFNALSDQDFEEVPVSIEEFVQSKDFLGLKGLSDYQYSLVKAMSQIYKYETLEALYGQKKAEEIYAQTCNEVIMQLGKGSGKDFTSTIAVAYIVHLLLCLKDPAAYFDKPEGDNIDIINIAVNADQAQRVFFDNFKNRIKKCNWFKGKYDETQVAMKFDKNINVYSGHSEREAFEGYNTIVVILDEISGFAMATQEELEQGKPPPKTSQALYDMYSNSVTSRFPSIGKLVSLSFPRFKNDFIQQLYNDSIADKEVVMRTHKFKIDPDLPDGFEGNEFEIEWEEDHIIRYKYPKTFALRRPSWEVNPNTNIDDPAFVKAFQKNKGDALGRFACMPSNLTDGFFKNKAAIEQTFILQNGVDDNGIFLDKFKPERDTEYYLHVDLAQKHDHCAVAMGHVEKWIEVEIGAVDYKEIHPVVLIDAVRYWTPTSEKSVDFADVRNYIISLRRRGFDIKLVTFDRWNSHDTMNILEREHGINTDTLSVAKKHYDDFLSTMYDGRLLGPKIDLLIEELGELREVKGKVDHPRKGSKDLSDAVCGAIFNAVSYTPKPENFVIEAVTYADVRERIRKAEYEKNKHAKEEQGVIKAPKPKMPIELEQYLDQMQLF